MITGGQNGEYDLTCDTCPEGQIMFARNWTELMEMVKAEGYVTRRSEDGDGWEHVCPGCVEEGK